METFIHRALATQLTNITQWFPVVSVTGPRQSGKSTLVKNTFPNYAYVNLEDPQIRASALEDPVSFIRNRNQNLIIDEAQYAPDLFAMIQVVSDERDTAGQYILTGSQNFLMMKSINQSLAGRVGLLKLFPLSFLELKNAQTNLIEADTYLLNGGYPRLHDSNIPPTVYFSNYIDTYIERDVVGLLDVRNKALFRIFLEMCAQNAGRLVNITSLSKATGVATATIRGWLSILESSYLTFTLQPYFANTKKRLTKTPKLYFYDTGLLCHLLKITTMDQLINNPSFGAIFENLIVAETVKKYANAGVQPELYFYRDDSKREIDLIDLTFSENQQAVEIKSSQTYHDKYAKHLNTVGKELGIPEENRFVVARVEASYKTHTCNVVSAKDWLTRI